MREFKVDKFNHGHRWGPWMLDVERLCLVRTSDDTGQSGILYEIDLESITSTFWLVDWLDHIEQKTWATPEVMGQLAIALMQLFRPRHRMRDGATIDPAAVLSASIEIQR